MNEVTQQRSFYIKFEQSKNIFSKYFGNGILFVDYDISWEKQNTFNDLKIKETKITNIKYTSNNIDIVNFNFNDLPENIKDTLLIALNYISKTIYPTSLNEPKLSKLFSEI